MIKLHPLTTGLLLVSTALLLSGTLHAQLPVDREPHHKVIQENPYYRLLEGKIPAGDTTPAHVHAANSVVIFLSHSTFGIQVIGDKPVITTVEPGDIKYVAYGDKPVNHLVWNHTPPLFHFYVVELRKRTPTADSCAVLSQAGITLQWQQPSVKAYELNITGTLHLGPAPCARLQVGITGGYHFYPPGTPIDLAGGRSILLEMP
ncbi:MAG TPA: hypothetical protein VNV35_20010 [Puia sp.]|nr:hypothetical protein [Puia sp.]